MAFGNATGQGFVNPEEVVTNKVIVEGSDGGVFIYNGTPGPGNPPIASVADSLTDPFGNAIVPGIASYLPSQGTSEMFGGVIQLYANAAQAGHQALIEESSAGTLELTSGGQSGSDVSSVMNLLSGLSGGTLQVTSGADGNVYDTMRLVLDGTALPQTISSTSPQVITGCSAPVAMGKYKFRAVVTFQGGTAAGTANFSFSGPAFSEAWVNAAFVMSNGTAGAGSQTAALGPVDSPTLTTNNSVAIITGEAVFTAAGTFAFKCAEGTGLDTVIIENVTVDLLPVTGTTGTGGVNPNPGGKFGKLVFLVPSGDDTGVIDAAAINAVYAAGEIPVLTPGDWYIECGQIVFVANTTRFELYACGNATVIHAVGAGDLFRIYQSLTSGVILSGGGIYGDPLILGTSTTGNSCAVHMGDIYQFHIDVTVQDWIAGTTSKGVWFDNQYLYTEQLQGTIKARNCRQHVVFDHNDVSGVSTGSMDRPNLTIMLDTDGAGDGVVWQNGAFAIDLVNLTISGNDKYNTTSATQYYVLKLIGQDSSNYSYLGRGSLNIGVELLNPGSGVQPGTIDFDSQGNNVIQGCKGLIDFSADAPYASANNSYLSFQFEGPIFGDEKLWRSNAGTYPFNIGGSISNGSIIYSTTDVYTANPGSNLTGLILQKQDTDLGVAVKVTVINISSLYSMTFDVPATSNVADGTSDTIPPLSAATYYWDLYTSLWYRVN